MAIYKIKGGAIQLDEVDSWLLKAYTWHCTKEDIYRHTPHVAGWMHGKPVMLHRIIANANKREEVDHINRNGLDNRRENLRIVDRFIQTANKNKCKKLVSSKYIGVSWWSQRKRFVAEIRMFGSLFYIGSYINEEDAAAAYDIVKTLAYPIDISINCKELKK